METNEQNVVVEESGISLADIFHIIRKHIIAIACFVVALTVIGFGFAKYKTSKSPTYEINTSMLVSVDKTNAGSMSSAFSVSYNLAETFVVFIEEDVVVDKVIDKLQATYPTLTNKNVKNGLSVSQNGDSLILELTYTSSNKKQCVDVINTIMEEAVTLANSTDASGEAVYKLFYSNLAIIDNASLDKVTLKSVTTKYTIIGFAAGVVLAFCYVLVMELLDKRFKSKDEVEKELNVPILAVIAKYDCAKERGL